MNRDSLISYILKSNIINKWHWYQYHFNFLKKGYEHPFVESLIDACLIVEKKIPGYSEKMIDRISSINSKEHYLPHYDQLLQILAEILVISHLSEEFFDSDFKDEPTIGNSKKNPEVTITTNTYILGVEVKAPKLREHQEQRSSKKIQIPGRTHFSEELIKNAGGKVSVTLPRDNPIKDFLISSNEKFEEFKKELDNFYGVLVIVWDDYIYEPITSIFSEHSGLFTKNSFAKDKEGNSLLFKNVDAVVIIRHLHIFVESLAERPLIDGKLTPMDYGKPNTFPFKALIQNPNGEMLLPEIIKVFDAMEPSHKLGAEYMPQEYIVW